MRDPTLRNKNYVRFTTLGLHTTANILPIPLHSHQNLSRPRRGIRPAPSESSSRVIQILRAPTRDAAPGTGFSQFPAGQLPSGRTISQTPMPPGEVRAPALVSNRTARLRVCSRLGSALPPASVPTASCSADGRAVLVPPCKKQGGGGAPKRGPR